MPFEFKLPDLGEGTTEVEIRKWLVREGDVVAEHQPLLEVETDKAVVEVPAPQAGRVASLHCREGETVRVGDVLLTLAGAEETTAARPKSVSVVGQLPEAEDVQAEIRAMPAARKLAREKGVDLAGLAGSGPGGVITREDVLAATGAGVKGEERFGTVERQPMRGVRRAVAKNVMIARQRTAFVTGMEEADVTDLWVLREREQAMLQAEGVHLTFLPFIVKAAQHALVAHPLLNASIDDETEEIVLKRYFNCGIAVETPDGLMVPVIRDVERKSIRELALEISRLGEAARARRITPEEMQGSSFTITNYGHFGGTFATPIINWPDVAILGCGRIADRPWVKGGAIVIRKILPLSLTFDHRVTDGADAAGFLTKLVRYLEDPALLFIESI